MAGGGGTRGDVRAYAERGLVWLQSRPVCRRLGRVLLGPRVTLREIDAGERAALVAAISRHEVAVRPIADNHVCWGAYVAGRPAGTVELFWNPLDAERLPGWWFGGLFVRPRYRGLGLGRRLVGAVVARAHAGGAPALYAWTAPDNARMQSLGADLGFVMDDDPTLVARCRAATGSDQRVLRLDLGGTPDLRVGPG